MRRTHHELLTKITIAAPFVNNIDWRASFRIHDIVFRIVFRRLVLLLRAPTPDTTYCPVGLHRLPHCPAKRVSSSEDCPSLIHWFSEQSFDYWQYLAVKGYL